MHILSLNLSIFFLFFKYDMKLTHLLSLSLTYVHQRLFFFLILLLPLISPCEQIGIHLSFFLHNYYRLSVVLVAPSFLHPPPPSPVVEVSYSPARIEKHGDGYGIMKFLNFLLIFSLFVQITFMSHRLYLFLCYVY